MSDARTVREAIDEQWRNLDMPPMDKKVKPYDEGIHEGVHRAASALHKSGILDYHILPCNAVVVPKEQWEAAVCALMGITVRTKREARDLGLSLDAWEAKERALAAIATALLGGKVYRATEVGTLRIDTEGRAYVWNDVDGDQPIADHSTIAILEEAHGKEEE